MRNSYRMASLALTLAAVGCTPDRIPTDLATPNNESGSEFSLWRAPRNGLRVMFQNMYVGANVDAIIGALASPDPNDDLATLAAQIGVLQETDFPTRAAKIADEIAKHRPHVVGLAEVSTIDVDLTGLGVSVVYHMDFLTVLKQALARRHLRYRVAGQVRNFEAAPLPGISLIDQDVVLVDADRVKARPDVIARTFRTNLGSVVPGVSLARGFVSVPVWVDGEQYRVTSTHLESDLGGNNLGLLRAAQVQELVGAIGDARHAVIMGDLNDFAGTPMYQVLLGAGYSDAWASLRSGQDGFTCCHADNLTNARVPDQRIDYVFARGFDRHDDTIDGFIRRIGLLPGDMVPGPIHPIWASDHAGLVAWLDPK
jgi:hypothetical protein